MMMSMKTYGRYLIRPKNIRFITHITTLHRFLKGIRGIFRRKIEEIKKLGSNYRQELIKLEQYIQ